MDESGDPGWLVSHGASPRFVVGIAVFSEAHAASTVTDRIETIRLRLKKPELEFHYSKNNRRIRDEFVRSLAAMPFTYYASVLTKDASLRLGGLDLSVAAC